MIFKDKMSSTTSKDTTLTHPLTIKLKSYIENEDNVVDQEEVLNVKDYSLLTSSLSNEEKTKLLHLIADDCNWFADDHNQTIAFIHHLIEIGADCIKCSRYMERVVGWFGMGSFALKEYKYLVEKGFDFTCLDKHRIKNCIKSAYVEDSEEQDSDDEEEAGEELVHDLKSRMEVFAEDDEVDATLDCIENAMRNYSSFNYDRQDNTYISRYDVNGKKIKITVSLE
jgi:hypothetical protein